MRKTIRRGSTGPEVAEWQRVVGVVDDGAFGPLTESATKRWQAEHQLVADGVVGPNTWGRAFPTKPVEPLLRGIDVSVVQGEVPWAAVAAAGIRFAIMRCAIGNEKGPDVRFRRNVAGAKAHGIVPGGYCFTFPLPHLEPVAQARHHARLLDRCGASAGELLPMADLEWPPREEWKTKPDGTKELVYPWRRWGCTAEQIAEWCLRYLEEAKRLTGVEWGRYTYRYWADCVEMRRHPEFANGPLWLADYVSPGRVPTPEEVAARKVPGPWSRIALVQHDGNGGLRLPNGVDSDFNVLVGGEGGLRDLTTGSSLWLDLPALTAAHVAVGDGDGVPPITDAEIRGYRTTRLTEAPNELSAT